MAVRFWLSPNRYLHPHAVITNDHKGNRVVKVLNSLEAKLVDGHKLTFAKAYFWWGSDESEASADFNLVATYSTSESLEEFASTSESVIAELDNYLLVVSLATRARTKCFGWDASAGSEIWSRYLPDVSIPTGYSRPSLNDGLIDRSDHLEFFQKAYQSLSVSPYKDALRSAAFALTPISPRVLESDFIALFSSLEEILLLYRRRSDLEFAMSPDQWRETKPNLKKAIKTLVDDKIARGRLYRKLDELNRVSLAESYADFIRHVRVDVSDLWPVFDCSGGVSLYQLRNWLSHGERLPLAAQENLWVALEHLCWTLERIVLVLLEWSVERSEVRARLLRTYATAMASLSSAREEISRAMQFEAEGDKGDGGH